jgi:HAD superfamily hydrolase (TIGR01458 family)
MSDAGLLLDLEGVLYQGNEPMPHAADAVAKLRERGVSMRYLTNTTTHPRRVIVERLTKMGFDVAADHVFTPGIAARLLLKQRQIDRVHLAAAEDLAEDLGGFELVDDHPQAIILGDLYRAFTWDRLNGLFQMTQQGALLVALHKNRYSRRGEQIALDLGPFVAALEYASDTAAEVVGKPSELFFKLALDDLGLAPTNVTMVGDDIEADIGGAQQVGIKTVQVRTGKFTARDLDHPSIRPDRRIESIADLNESLV